MITCALPDFDSDVLISFQNPTKFWILLAIYVIAALYLLCSLISELTSLLAKLKIHKRSHSKEKVYKCTICEHSSSYNLGIHMRTHNGEKPFKCGQCEFAAFQKGGLRIHMIKHNGVKSIKCDQCDFATGYRAHLKKHKSLHLPPN